ncbi:ComEA family DNA-binding protein [Sorangium sp. So ce131]|uniref:ComEA family DNA-binding protein n=1 Tax=Sorangium sp. So ce131 TaxID=3133282 RepID=UPI003F5E4AA4
MAEKIDINRASAEDLQRTFQVNEQCAQIIVERREEMGGFSSWEEIKQVAGIDDAILETLKDSGFLVAQASTPARKTRPA